MFRVRSSIVSVSLIGIAAMLSPGLARADQRGHASWYSLPANITANGEQMDPGAMTAAHRSLPFGTRVLVENLTNGRFVIVRINDRGPFVGGRIIDLSKGAAASIGMVNSGIAKVRVSILSGKHGPSRIPVAPGWGLIEASAESVKSAKMAAADLPAPKRITAKTPEPKQVAAKTRAPKQAAAKRRSSKAAVAKAVPSRSVSKASRKQVPSASKADAISKHGSRRAIAVLAEPQARSSRKSRKQTASITGAARAARSLRANAGIAVARAQRQKRKNPYTILADTPGFLKAAALDHRRGSRRRPSSRRG